MRQPAKNPQAVDHEGAAPGEAEAAEAIPLVTKQPADATVVDPRPPAGRDLPPDDAEADANAPTPAVGPTPPDGSRYSTYGDGDARAIVSGNAPNIELRVVRGLTVDGRSSKNYDKQTIFLDGVYSGPPFLNNEARHYSLDHHAGCVRAFTLATCEQAVVMLMQGLPLASGKWTLLVNDPDLDSMLAAWVLMNHVELLNDDKALLREAMPIIRLEGVIDAHGTDRELLTGFPEALQRETRHRVDALMEEERGIKARGGWPSTDFVEFAKSALRRIDEGLLSPALLGELLATQEAGRATLANGRICVLIDSTEGIYAVEARLKQRYGSTLGVIVLAVGPGRYTLRLVDAFLRRDLTAVYKALNRLDPRASASNAWGGAGDIGGSPRALETGLSSDQILEVFEAVLGEQPPWYAKAWAFLRGLIDPKRKKLPPGS